MSSLRENPVRRPRRNRPPWLLPVLIGVAALVVIGVVVGVVSLVRGGSDDTASTEPSPGASPCVTATVVPIDVLPPANRVRVNVYNATQTAGLAGKVAKELGARDFKVVKIANDPRGQKIDGVAQIRYGPKGERAAQTLAFQVPGAVLIDDARTGRIVDIAVGEQFTGLAAIDEVAAAMASPTPVASGPGCPAG